MIGTPNGPALHAASLRKVFGGGQNGEVVAVDDIDLSVAPGEVVALLGPNGAGKTTAIEMMLGLRRPDAGEVSVFGQQPREAIVAGHVGAMLQAGGLVADLSVREVVHLVASMHAKPLSVDEALDRAGISDLARRRIGTLSGGQRQRVLFAVAVVPDPDLLVLDEPTVAMDVESRRAFWVAMRQLASSGRTVLFATHYLDEADDNADRIVLMARGRIVADGPATEIKATVDTRRIRATLPGVDQRVLEALPGVSAVEIHGERVQLVCTDADTALRELIASQPLARDFEVTGGSLEDAFLALTSGESA